MDWTILVIFTDLVPSFTTLHVYFVCPITHLKKGKGARVHGECHELCFCLSQQQMVKSQTQCQEVSNALKHLIEPWHTTSHRSPSDTAAISQHDSLKPSQETSVIIRACSAQYSLCRLNETLVSAMSASHLPLAADTTPSLSKSTSARTSRGNSRCNLSISRCDGRGAGLSRAWLVMGLKL